MTYINNFQFKMKYYILLFVCPWVESLRILSVFPTVTKSHYLSGRPILLELLNRGHEVVSISPFEEISRVNYTWIEVEVKSLFEAVPNLKEELGQDYSFFGYLNYVWRTMNTYAIYITKRPKLTEFIRNDTSHFDVIFAHDFYLPILYAFAYKYNAPLIVMSTFGHAHYIQNYMGGHFDYSYPHEFSNLDHPLNLFDIIRNCIYVLYDFIGRKVQMYRYQNTLVPELFGIQALDLQDLENNIKLVLINSHYTTSIPKATLPNIVEVGGLHIEEPKPLFQELQDILDGAEHGAILLSLGSVIELGSQQEALITSVFTTLASLKQRVIMKWNSDANTSTYSNIYTFPWLPQNDILAHPNLKLFINHGGVLSNHEAVFHGVPIICIPFQANQHQVCQSSVTLGYAIRILKYQVGNNLNDSIQKILSDRRFRTNALEASRRFKDRPITALDTAVFWIEFCSRNKSFFKKSREVTIFVIVLFLLIILSIFYIVMKKRNNSLKVKKS